MLRLGLSQTSLRSPRHVSFVLLWLSFILQVADTAEVNYLAKMSRDLNPSQLETPAAPTVRQPVFALVPLRFMSISFGSHLFSSSKRRGSLAAHHTA
jgi:ABC-type transport system involved in multi-copper enzyme maturation permease subunit